MLCPIVWLSFLVCHSKSGQHNSQPMISTVADCEPCTDWKNANQISTPNRKYVHNFLSQVSNPILSPNPSEQILHPQISKCHEYPLLLHHDLHFLTVSNRLTDSDRCQVIMWTLIDIIAISFRLYLHTT